VAVKDLVNAGDPDVIGRADGRTRGQIAEARRVNKVASPRSQDSDYVQ
jgi:hypothetical protein